MPHQVLNHAYTKKDNSQVKNGLIGQYHPQF